MWFWFEKIFIRRKNIQENYINGAFSKNAFSVWKDLVSLYANRYDVDGSSVNVAEVGCFLGFLIVHSLNRRQYYTKLTSEQEFQIALGIYLKFCYPCKSDVSVADEIDGYIARYKEYAKLWAAYQYSKDISEVFNKTVEYFIDGGSNVEVNSLNVRDFNNALDKAIIKISCFCK
jgi:hypothetical protein